MVPTPLVPGHVAEHTSCLLVKLGQVLFRLAEDQLEPLGLRVRHYSILQALADNGAMSQLALGAYLRIDPATVVGSLDDLELLALAARTRDPRDRRRHFVDVTTAGCRVLAAANDALVELDTRVTADLLAPQRLVLRQLLNALSAGPALPAAFDETRAHGGRKLPSSVRR
jgi:DNA-binding MarR family transcriptional regulator